MLKNIARALNQSGQMYKINFSISKFIFPADDPALLGDGLLACSTALVSFLIIQPNEPFQVSAASVLAFLSWCY